MKKIAVIVSVLLLAACEPTATDVRSKYAPPAELKDCSFHNLGSSSGNSITVVRCPNSSTTTKYHAKSPRTVIVVDGAEYEKVVK